MTLVQLDRRMDREKPCCGNTATIGGGKGPHAAELRCAGCGRHRGWLPKSALDFVSAVADQFGAITDPIILKDETIGDFKLTKFENKNCGVLFKNERKESEKHADYTGEVNAAGLDYWLNGYVRTSKKGTKFISFKLKLKDDQSGAEPKPEFDDAVRF